MTQPLLQVDGLCAQSFTKTGVVTALDEVSFTVDRGEVLGLVGESSSGASLTGYAIMGLVDPPGRIVGGRVAFAGSDLCALPEEEMRQLRGNRMAMVFRDPVLALDPMRRIDAQMVETILAHERISRPEALARAREALIKVGMPSPDVRLKAFPHQLSSATRQWVAIAIALLNRPDLVIADEPTAALDATILGQIRRQMRSLTRETGAALIWITHDLSRIAGLADRLCVMYAGRVVEAGATADVLGTPRHPYTRGLLDSAPGSAPPHEKLKQMSGTIPSLAELPPGCAFRPRCPYATAECAQTPQMRPYGAIGQAIRCFHPLAPPG